MNFIISLIALLFINTPVNSTSPATPTVERTAPNRVEITIEGSDQMKFNLSEIKVKAGDKVVLTLKHTGKLPKTAMGHNWVLLKSGTVVKDFAMEAMKAKDNEYIPEGNDIIAHTDLVGGGEETTVEFTAPGKGEYDFICSFPGHYALMKGKFIVE